MTDEPQRPTSNEDRAGWKAYWAAQGMSWRTEPEIDGERQRFLGERRAVRADIEKGKYAFRDENGSITLTRADVEWLLATHVDATGHTGPVMWRGEREWRPDSIDLRGADLAMVNLANLPLTRLLASLRFDEWERATDVQREQAAVHLEFCHLREVHLEGANLRHAHLEGAMLRDAHLHGVRLHGAHLEQANLSHAHLEGARLNEAHLGGKRLSATELAHARQRLPAYPAQLAPASLQLAYLDGTTDLDKVNLSSGDGSSASLVDVQWGGANLAVVAWEQVPRLGDERAAWEWTPSADDRSTWKALSPTAARAHRREGQRTAFEAAARANRQLAAVLRGQGVSEQADKYAYRAQVLQRHLLRLRRHAMRSLGSWLLDLISGYGYKPMRSLFTYVLVVLGFAVAYFLIAEQVGLSMPPLAALVFSVTSFHGRGFMPGENVSLTNPVTVLAASEAIIGLLIEITFIATFTQRFFAR